MNHRDQSVPVERFGRVVGAAGVEAFSAITLHRVRCQGYDGQMTPAPSQFRCRVASVHHRHLHVHHDQVHRRCAVTVKSINCLAAIRGGDYISARFLDEVLGQVEDQPTFQTVVAANHSHVTVIGKFDRIADQVQ